MKNLKLLLLIIISALLITSCTDDEESQNADIVGIWNVTDLDLAFSVNNESLATFFGSSDQATVYESLFSTIFEDAFEDTTIEFKSDGTYTSNSPGETAETGTWVLSNNKITFDEGTAEGLSFSVISSTKSALTLQYKETDSSEDLDGDGTNDEFEIILDLNLTK